MKLLDLIQTHRQELLQIAALHGAYDVRVFGSTARGTDDEKSDIDLLVKLEKGRSLMDLGGLVYDLRILLGVEVDVVTEKGLQPRIRERALNEAIPV